MQKMLITLLFIVSLVSIASAGSQYDAINKNENYQKVLVGYDTIIAPKQLYVNYLNLLINYNDLIALAKSGEVDKERSKYLMENSNTFIKYCHMMLLSSISQNKQKITDAQIAYVIGVVTSPNAQAATTSSQYQVEQEVLRGFVAYKAWELARSPGFIPKFVNEELTKFYAVLNK